MDHAHSILASLDLSHVPNESLGQPTAWEVLAATNIRKAQDCYAKYANQHRRPTTFAVGDLVLVQTKDLELDQYSSRPNHALSNKYIGPYKIIASLSPNAFTLRFPLHISIHPTFHALQLCPYYKTIHTQLPSPITNHLPKMHKEPISAILDKCVFKGNIQYKVFWENADLAEWVPCQKLENAHQLIIEWEDLIAGPPTDIHTACLRASTCFGRGVV
eukprot:Phypoly_transcript_10948.p1 GENE.Phypoly_transcript_10948~~Phypoly_transcript_10948.p1  ORF type:complete len:217 (+),score=23.00 Phypoly_transcript_10948:340-990(+)